MHIFLCPLAAAFFFKKKQTKQLRPNCIQTPGMRPYFGIPLDFPSIQS